MKSKTLSNFGPNIVWDLRQGGIITLPEKEEKIGNSLKYAFDTDKLKEKVRDNNEENSRDRMLRQKNNLALQVSNNFLACISQHLIIPGSKDMY